MTRKRKSTVPDCDRCGGDRIITGAGPRADFAQARRCTCWETCPLCDGQAFFFETDANGYRFARPCKCVGIDRRIRHFADAHIPSRYSQARLQDFLFQTPGDPRFVDARAAAQAALRFTREYEPGRPGLLFYGRSGTGKTHLIVATLRALIIGLGVRARFIEFMHLLADLRATFGDQGRAEDVMGPLIEVPVLAIDELGKGRSKNEWEQSVLDELITKRYNAHRTTLFTTNYEPQPREGEAIADRVGARIFSRITEMCSFHRIDGEDLRRIHAP